jgi:hypothetical protein
LGARAGRRTDALPASTTGGATRPRALSARPYLATRLVPEMALFLITYAPRARGMPHGRALASVRGHSVHERPESLRRAHVPWNLEVPEPLPASVQPASESRIGGYSVWLSGADVASGGHDARARPRRRHPAP